MNAHRSGSSDLTGLSLAAIALALVAMALLPGSGRGARAKAPQAVFGSLLSRYCRLWNAAAQARDPSKAAPLYAKDSGLVFYGLGESEYRGWSAYGKGIESALFDNATSLRFAPGGDVRVTKKGNVAWTTATVHVSIVWADGRDQELDAQQTAVWEKRGNRWLIVHEHLSSPALRVESAGI